jgi:hypothetical protein
MYLTFKKKELFTAENVLKFINSDPIYQATMIYQVVYKYLSISNNELYLYNVTTEKYKKINYNIQDYLATLSRKLILESSTKTCTLLHDLNYYRNFVHDLYFLLCEEEEDEEEEEEEEEEEDEVIIPLPKTKKNRDDNKRWEEVTDVKHLNYDDIPVPDF